MIGCYKRLISIMSTCVYTTGHGLNLWEDITMLILITFISIAVVMLLLELEYSKHSLTIEGLTDQWDYANVP